MARTASPAAIHAHGVSFVGSAWTLRTRAATVAAGAPALPARACWIELGEAIVADVGAPRAELRSHEDDQRSVELSLPGDLIRNRVRPADHFARSRRGHERNLWDPSRRSVGKLPASISVTAAPTS